jgi:hypothetical protein
MFYLNEDVRVSSRYDMIKFFEMNKDNLDPLTSFYAENIKRLPYVGEYTVIKEVKRPDLLSYNIYGSTQYWWILLLYNDLSGVNDLVAGAQIRYPSHSTIEELYVLCSTIKKATAE